MAGAFADMAPANLREDTLTEEEKKTAASLNVGKHSSYSWVWEGTDSLNETSIFYDIKNDIDEDNP
jgi:hypothetical protein